MDAPFNATGRQLSREEVALARPRAELRMGTIAPPTSTSVYSPKSRLRHSRERTVQSLGFGGMQYTPPTLSGRPYHLILTQMMLWRCIFTFGLCHARHIDDDEEASVQKEIWMIMMMVNRHSDDDFAKMMILKSDRWNLMKWYFLHLLTYAYYYVESRTELISGVTGFVRECPLSELS